MPWISSVILVAVVVVHAEGAGEEEEEDESQTEAKNKNMLSAVDSFTTTSMDEVIQVSTDKCYCLILYFNPLVS